jgi:hypothetical protein
MSIAVAWTRIPACHRRPMTFNSSPQPHRAPNMEETTPSLSTVMREVSSLELESQTLDAIGRKGLNEDDLLRCQEILGVDRAAGLNTHRRYKSDPGHATTRCSFSSRALKPKYE